MIMTPYTSELDSDLSFMRLLFIMFTVQRGYK